MRCDKGKKLKPRTPNADEAEKISKPGKPPVEMSATMPNGPPAIWVFVLTVLNVVGRAVALALSGTRKLR